VLIYGSAVLGGVWGALLLAGVVATYVSVAPETPAPVALIIPFAIALIAPVIMAFGEIRRSRLIGAGLVGMAGLGMVYFAISSSFSPRHPKPGDLFHYSDLRTGKSYWATGSTPRQLPGGEGEKLSPAGFENIEWQAVQTGSAALPPPEIVLTEGEGRTVVSMTSAIAPRMMTMRLTPSSEVGNVTVNGRKIILRTDQATRISWRAETPDARLSVEFNSGVQGNLDIDYLYAVAGMPAGAPPSAGPDTDWTFLNGARVIGGSTKLDLGRAATPE
jgi:hypothetical protein